MSVPPSQASGTFFLKNAKLFGSLNFFSYLCIGIKNKNKIVL